MNRFPRTALWLSACLALVVASGCMGPKLVKVTGKVTNNGQPLKLGSTSGVLQITLIPVVEPGQPYTTFPGRADPADGTFTIADVPAGKYKVAVEQLDPTPMQDKLNGVFSVQKTTIVRDVDGAAPLSIDLAKPGS